MWGDVFDRHHLDMAFSGHVHYYLRSKPMYDGKPAPSPAEGTIYVTSVAIPASDEEQLTEDYAEVHFGGGMLYQTINIDGKKLIYRAINFEGEIRDEVVIVK